MNKQISIIGCGWLGFPLATHLIKQGYQIKGSTTSKHKLEGLKSAGIEAFYIELNDNGINGELEKCFAGSDILILNVPPGLRKHPENDFVKQMALLISHLKTSSIKNIIFISSTSVYGDEESIPTITEETIPNPESESGKQLLEVETLLQNNHNFTTTVLRFAGLFGEDRHPAKYLSGKTDIKNPDAPVNLVHLIDCIAIISTIIEKGIWSETFNVSTTPHPSRKVYYTSVCNSLGLQALQFVATSKSEGKRIDSNKLVRLLDYQFQVKLNN